MDDKEAGYDFVHRIRLGKEQCFPDKQYTRLSQGAIPTFHMIGLSAALANTFMCLSRKNEWIGFLEVTVTLATFVGM